MSTAPANDDAPPLDPELDALAHKVDETVFDMLDGVATSHPAGEVAAALFAGAIAGAVRFIWPQLTGDVPIEQFADELRAEVVRYCGQLAVEGCEGQA